VRPGTLPKSSSGKVQRSQCRTLYLARHFDAVSVDSRSLATSL
jgi:acyl-CoA synthetase (AMP-forming)/AMP-acid ligase II